MEKRSVHGYYIFGTQIRYLQDANSQTHIKGPDLILENINRFLYNIEKLGLNVTKRAAWRLYKLKKELESSDENSLLGQNANELSEIMYEIRIALDAEIKGLEAFITTPKRFNIDVLLENINNLFAPNIFNMFCDMAKFDFIEAGQCIAFERSTAAAFHILRATEANLRFYYTKLIKRNRIQSNLWGSIIDDLRRKAKTKKYKTLYNHLDHIRVSFRNPTQHPEAKYDIHEVQDLLSVCIDANNRMFKILLELEKQ